MQFDYKLPDVLSKNERELAVAAFAGRHRDAYKWGNVLLAAYDALVTRVRLAELAVYRAHLLPGEFEPLIAQARKRGRAMTPEEIANLVGRYDRDSAVPLLEPLREAAGFTGVPGPWYPESEEIRAKLIGSKRTQERLVRERGER